MLSEGPELISDEIIIEKLPRGAKWYTTGYV
jgi:hypothetical protein